MFSCVTGNVGINVAPAVAAWTAIFSGARAIFRGQKVNHVCVRTGSDFFFFSSSRLVFFRQHSHYDVFPSLFDSLFPSLS